MVTLSRKLKNAAQVAIRNNDKRKVLQNIYMDPCYIYATDGHLLYRGWHGLKIKKSMLADLSEAKKGKLTLKECPEEKYLNLYRIVPKYDGNYTISIKVNELLAAAKSVETFLKGSDDKSCELSFKRENGLISLRARNGSGFIHLGIENDMNEVSSKNGFSIYFDPALMVQALKGLGKKETIFMDFYGPLKPFTIKDIAGEQLFLIAPMRKF
ncbi:hypothetical protein A3Q24_05755 [Lactobacillus johnsonii]|uniref:DNA polymerase III beta sliding clamp C-terminal domain-containing protein n=1 Tax=Lactobacillus johnsonii TaxID=33959 RepID=A0A267M8M3_LACJH|nr:hypothetical protein [Lactobacillus johnsonii]PAB55185.1 hypothetical protein A3Q24_05755 [Lactobacillus johnsonii]